MTPVGAGIAASLYLAAALIGLWRTGRRPGLRASLALLALPFVFNLLLALGSPLFDRAAAALAPIPLPIGLAALRGLALFGFNEATAFGACIALGRRAPRGAALHGLLLAAAFGAAVTPIVAELGSSAFVAHLFAPLDILLASAAAAIAQAGLWAEVYLVTTVLGDILHGAPPVAPRLTAATRSGAEKGAMFGAVFMALLLIVAAFAQTPDAMAVLRASSWMGAALAGALLFPLGRTILEIDRLHPAVSGAAPERLSRRATRRAPWRARASPSPSRMGCRRPTVSRASVSASVSARRRRSRPCSSPTSPTSPRAFADEPARAWRPYALGVLLGGILGGAISWYFDQGQLEVVVAHFHDHVAVNYAAAARPETPYVITPFFSKWGATYMGPVTGGVKLFYLKSLSGVIQWIFAAPLFSMNLFLFTALLTRSTAPIKKLFSAEGMGGLADNAIVVLRWGLWMRRSSTRS